MTGPRFASFTAPSSYWQASRAPRYSLLFALPLLVFYQVLAVRLAAGPRSVRNGADVILQSVFTAVAGRWGPLLFMTCLIGGGLWLVARDARAHGSRFKRWVFLGMLGESLLLALAFGIVVGGVTSGVLGLLQTLALAAAARTLFGWSPLAAGSAATLLGAAIFSAFLYIGPYGDRLQLYSFLFRLIAGLFFSALYLLRGFGITAWTHALYDVSLLLLS